METGFLNQIHDEEHFPSTFYNQENGLDGTENMLFGEMIVPDIIDYEKIWQSVDDLGFPSQSGESSSCREDLQRMVNEWQDQLTYMQEPEAIKQLVTVADKTTQEVSEILSNRNCTSSPTIDDLFFLDEDKSETEDNHLENNKCIVKVEHPQHNIRETICEKSNETVAADINLKQEPLVRNLKKEIEEAGGDVDVETVGEEVPLLMARDLTSLLEQFEATERVNSIQPPFIAVEAASPPRPSTQTIRDALPPEIINRIKATRENHKKIISVIPAMPSKKTGRGATRMQDAGVALSRNKLLKLVTGGSSGESVQLDHDYCTNGSDSASNSSRSCYVSDSSEYPSQASTPDTSYSRVPEYLVSLLPQKLKEQTRATDTGSRKDSGLESGENSDEDMGHPMIQAKNKVPINSVPMLKSVSVKTGNGVIINSPVIQHNVPMVSVLKKNNVKVENKKDVSTSAISVSDCVSAPTQNSANTLDISKKKKKLNLEEYRVRREERDRIRSQESSRASSPVSVSCGTWPAQPDSTTACQEGVSKEKPLMLSVEVQTQTCDFIDLTSVEDEKSGKDRKDKRNDLKHKSYRSRHVSTSSSSSSAGSDRYHSHRRKRRSRSDKRRASRMWSRSPSRSSSTHSTSSRSRSRSHDRRQKWRSRSPHRNNSSYRSNNRSYHRREGRDQSWHRSRSPVRPVRSQDFGTQEKVRQIEERRVIYVGRIDEGTTKADLRKRFQQFGHIVDISVHFRERGDNYGFVTFAYKSDAYRAVEHGNDDPKLPRYDLCFGGRRAFCKQRYADLDGMVTNGINSHYRPAPPPKVCGGESFDLLLHEVKSQMRKRSSV